VTIPVQTSAGAGSAGDIVALNSAGTIDTTMLPAGIGPGVYTAITSENLAAGDFVNLYSNVGVITVRKADASAGSAAKQAHGFVIAAVTSPALATIYPLGEDNTGQTGLTVGEQWLSDTTAGKTITAPPSTSGHLVQQVGVALSTTNIVTTANGSMYIR
jgi:hypothetical protein